MRFIVDECTGPGLANWLTSEGHDVFSVFDDARGADDDTILDVACREDRILITNDSDFGEMVFRKRLKNRGVVFLRLKNSTKANQIEIMRNLLSDKSDQLPGNFVVVTENKVRIATLPNESQ